MKRPNNSAFFVSDQSNQLLEEPRISMRLDFPEKEQEILFRIRGPGGNAGGLSSPKD